MPQEDVRNQVIRYGILPVDSVTGLPICPTPSEIICLKVDKVYNECKQSDVNNIPFRISPPRNANGVRCVSAVVEDGVCEVDTGTVTVTFDLVVTFQLLQGSTVVATITERIQNETKTVRLRRAGERGLECEVDIFPECLLCFISETNPSGLVTEVTCCIGKLFLFKLFARVQVLVPSFGFCPEPPECETVAGLCPDFSPEWPPYPPQVVDNGAGEDNDSGGCHCS